MISENNQTRTVGQCRECSSMVFVLSGCKVWLGMTEYRLDYPTT